MNEINIQPIYLQLKTLLQEKIQSGVYPVGACLPSERNLEEMYNVSRISVRRTLECLIEEGYIEKSTGRRSIVKQTGPGLVRNMAFVTLLSRDALLDVYRMSYEAMLMKCNSCGINLYYVDVSRTLPAFLKNIKFETFFISGNVNEVSHFGEIINENVRLIALDHIFPEHQFASVCTDNYSGGQMSAEYLIGRGRKKLLFLGVATAYQSYPPFEERKKGFIEAARRNGAEYDVLDISGGAFENIKQELTEYLHDHEIDAIFAFNDHVAFYTLKTLAAMGRKVPEEIAVMGFDGLEIGNFFSPSLTTAAQPVNAIVRQAFDLAMMHNFTRETYKIPVQIIQREST